MGQPDANLSAGTLATIASIISAFGVAMLVFRIQRELRMREKGYNSWITWSDWLLITATEISLLLVLLPLLIAASTSKWALTVAQVGCMTSCILAAGFVPGILAHYRFILGTNRSGETENPEPAERPIVYLTIAFAILTAFFTLMRTNGEGAVMLNTISLLVAVASLFVSLVVTAIANESLRQARRVADRDREDWKQRKWFDLYYEADKAYDVFDKFQATYANGPPSSDSVLWPSFLDERNQLMFSLRRIHSMAAVFPVNQVANELFSATQFSDDGELFSKDRLKKIFDAVQSIRDKALIKNPDILG